MKKIGEVYINPLAVNLLALVLAMGTYIFIYRGLWNISSPDWARGAGFIFLVILVILLMFAHEGIHMLAARLADRRIKASLHIGLLTWQCRLQSPLRRSAYVIYSLAPGLGIGILGLIGYYYFASADLKFLSAVSFVVGFSSGAGDYWFVYRVLKYPASIFILDNGIQMDILSPEV